MYTLARQLLFKLSPETSHDLSLDLIGAGGRLGGHVHSYEESFYLLEGSVELTIDGRAVRLEADDCGLVPVGVPHAWRNTGDVACRWIEHVHDVTAPEVCGRERFESCRLRRSAIPVKR